MNTAVQTSSSVSLREAGSPVKSELRKGNRIPFLFKPLKILGCPSLLLPSQALEAALSSGPISLSSNLSLPFASPTHFSVYKLPGPLNPELQSGALRTNLLSL